MKAYRCKCGKREAFGSDAPLRCERCPECGTTLAEFSGQCTAPIPHNWREFFTIDPETGDRGKIHECLRCLERETIAFKFFVNETEFSCLKGDITVGQLRAIANIDPALPLFTVFAGRQLDNAERIGLDNEPALWCDRERWSPPTSATAQAAIQPTLYVEHPDGTFTKHQP